MDRQGTRHHRGISRDKRDRSLPRTIKPDQIRETHREYHEYPLSLTRQKNGDRGVGYVGRPEEQSYRQAGIVALLIAESVSRNYLSRVPRSTKLVGRDADDDE